MNVYTDEGIRSPVDLALFAAGCGGFFFGVAGVVVTSIPVAVFGAAVVLLTLGCFKTGKRN